MQHVVTRSLRRCLSQDELIFFVFDAHEINKLEDNIYTDGNAVSGRTNRFYKFHHVYDHLDWDIIGTRNGYDYRIQLWVYREQLRQYRPDLHGTVCPPIEVLPDLYYPEY